MENNKFSEEPDKKEPEQEKKSWFERNLWMIAVFIAIFLLRMCHDLA